MTEQLGKLSFLPGRPHSINQCLMVLGAKKEDAYLGSSSSIYPYKHFYSIYNKYTEEDLYFMVEDLFKKSMKKYHVDLHSNSEERELYGEMTKMLNEAHQKALKILDGRFGRR